MGIAFMTLSMVVYTVHVIYQDIDGGATEADGGASAPVGPSVATPLHIYVIYICYIYIHIYIYIYMLYIYTYIYICYIYIYRSLRW